MNEIHLYGWNTHLAQLKEKSNFSDFSHGRIKVVNKTCYEVIAEEGTFLCELTGNLLFGKSAPEYPCTGDWVLFQPTDYEKGIIFDILPRNKTLYRRKSGTISDVQAIAAYVDKAFIVQSMDANFNIRRIERFVAQIMEEEIMPVLILTKSDMVSDHTEIKDALKHLSCRIAVFYISIFSAEKIRELKSTILPGETIVFIGASGVGKSSLINELVQENILSTSSVSHATGKGRHTSVKREMVCIPGGGILIDTPGVREFGLTVESLDGFSATLDISDLEKSCRYKNCTHQNEPGCAVIEAVENGSLDQGTYRNYLKLRREVFHFTEAKHDKRKREKIFSKIVKNVVKEKKER